MACIILEGPQGRRLIPENTPYRMLVGETVVGADMNCGPMQPGDSNLGMREELAERGVQWGDAIAWVTKRLGVKQCAPCKARQEILNNVAAVGWTETLKQIKETF